jgi:hypothetical protein
MGLRWKFYKENENGISISLNMNECFQPCCRLISLFRDNTEFSNVYFIKVCDLM